MTTYHERENDRRFVFYDADGTFYTETRDRSQMEHLQRLYPDMTVRVLTANQTS